MAATTAPDLRPYLVGHTASVHIAGTKNNVLWDVWSEALPGNDMVYGLTSLQVRETLTSIYNLPAD